MVIPACLDIIRTSGSFGPSSHCPYRIQRATVTCPRSPSRSPEPRAPASQPGSFKAPSGLRSNIFQRRLFLQSFSGVGFVLSLPAYHRLPCTQILHVGVLAITHSFPNGMLVSDKEPWGRQGLLTWKLLSRCSLSTVGRFYHSPSADGKTESQGREMSLGPLTSDWTPTDPPRLGQQLPVPVVHLLL